MKTNNCEAWTLHQMCRTRVWRSGTRRDAAARVSRCIMPRGIYFFFKLTCADAALTRAISAWISRIGRNRRNGWFRPKFKEKKKVQNTPFELNIKPSFRSFHTNTPNSALCLSLSSSLTRLSLSLCSLPLSLLAVRHSASAESVTWLTSIHSFFSSLSRILNSGNDIKLSILVWSLICDLWFVSLSSFSILVLFS